MKPSKPNTPPQTDAAIKKDTGKSFKEWFAILDEAGGPALGRRALSQLVVIEPKAMLVTWGPSINFEYEKKHGIVEKDGRPKGYTICITKSIAAPPAAVYAVAGDGKTWKKWFGTNAKADVKEGGKYSCDDGDQGTFTRVRENKDLRMTVENPRHAGLDPYDIAFQVAPKDKTMLMVTINRIPSRELADELRDSWTAAFDQLKALVEGK